MINRFLLAVTVMLTLPGCGEKPQAIEETAATRQPDSWLISNVSIIDGSGADAYAGSVRVQGDRILAVGNLDPGEGETVVDGLG